MKSMKQPPKIVLAFRTICQRAGMSPKIALIKLTAWYSKPAQPSAPAYPPVGRPKKKKLMPPLNEGLSVGKDLPAAPALIEKHKPVVPNSEIEK